MRLIDAFVSAFTILSVIAGIVACFHPIAGVAASALTLGAYVCSRVSARKLEERITRIQNGDIKVQIAY